MADLSATLLAAILATGAPATGDPVASFPVADAAAEDTRALFDKASSQYETSQYDGAVETYTEAYQRSGAIEDEELRGRVQAAILFNLARAHSKAYTFDNRAEHLLQVVELLDKYLVQTADLADKLDAEALLAEAKAELARLEREADEAADAEPVVTEAPKRPGVEKGGYALLSLGIAGGGVAIAGAVLAPRAESDYFEGPTRDDRDAAQRLGASSNVMIVAGSVSAAVLVVTGVAMIVAGRRGRERVSPSAWLTPTGAGVSVGGSF